MIAFGPLLFHAARALRDLGVLTALEAKPLLASEVTSRCQITADGARVLLDAGAALGLVEESADSRYSLTPTGHLLLRDEMTRVNMDFVADVCYAGAASLNEAVRTGRPAGLRGFGDWETIYQGLAQLPDSARQSWLRFDHYYSDAAFPQAADVVFRRRPRRLLDVGGNTGRWTLECVRRDPAIRVTVLDHPGQLEVLRAAVAEAGFAERVTGIAADLLDRSKPFPGGFDVVWMSQFLDCFAEADAEDLLRRGRGALGPEGRLYVLEPLRDRQPNAIGEFCLRAASLYFTCMASGRSRFFDSNEMRRLVEAAGLTVEDMVDGLGVGHTLLVCRPA